MMVLAALVLVAILIGLFTSVGSEDARTDFQRGGEVGMLPSSQ